MKDKRIDIRVSQDLLDRVDARREVLGQSRTVFIERALEKALSAGERSEVERMPPVARPDSAPPRTSVKPAGELPKIAPRHWA